MSYSSEDETDISDSELEEYVDRCYLQLKENGDKTVKFSDELFRCPYCPGKKKIVYAVKDLLQHATDVGKGSQNRDIKHKGKHLGLVRYVKTDLVGEDLSLELSGLHLEPAPRHGMNEVFIWPWMGVLANVDSEGSISTLKNDLVQRGFDVARVRPLSSGKYAVVEFKKDWLGFYNALKFEKEFEDGHHGKKDYSSVSALPDGLYGWVARDDDYKSEGTLGEYLQKNGDLKTLSDVEADQTRKNELLIAHLNKIIQEKGTRIDELEGNCGTPGASILRRIARDDDYKSEGTLGESLQKNGDLKTLADMEADEKRKTELLIAHLNKIIQEKGTRIDELEGNCATPGAP